MFNNAAMLAIEAGAAGIIVSNHGARQLDYVPATIMALEEVHFSLLISLMFMLLVFRCESFGYEYLSSTGIFNFFLFFSCIWMMTLFRVFLTFHFLYEYSSNVEITYVTWI